MKADNSFKDSLLRDYMLHRSAASRLPLAGMTMGRTLAGMFVENELLVNERDDGAIALLVDRFGGDVIPPKPLPERPRELHCATARDTQGMPQMVTVRIKGEDAPLDALTRLITREQREGFEVSSRGGAGTLAVAQVLREKGLGGHLNLAGTPAGRFPDVGSNEGSFPSENNAYLWPEYAGKSNITRAWELCQALDNVRSMKRPIFIGILDVGYAFVGPADYATGQFNLTNEGASIVGATSIGSYAFHGSGVAGIAAAEVGNNIGAAGVGGLRVGAASLPVAMPFMFRTNHCISEIYRCLQCCVAWGIDVLNMSFSIIFPKILLPFIDEWDGNFQFAKDQGLIMVAAASNDGAELPDKMVLPATRTPGVITVGWLDGSGNAADARSNYGSSVDVWAPGTNIHTVPDPNTASVFLSGTSAAAPIVSGVAALLKSANPALRPDDVKAILRDTAWTDSPDWKSNRILNAYQAVLRAINFALPPGTFEEPNDSPGAAKQMLPTTSGMYAPFGETVISRAGDVDFHRFTLSQYSDVMIVLNYVRPLSIVTMELLPDAADSLAFNNLTDNRGPGVQVLSFTQAPPGNYLIKVRGQAPNYYTLNAKITPKPLEPDIFESNDTKDKAATIHLRTPKAWEFVLHTFFPGAYEATITAPLDVDWYHVTDITTGARSFPDCKIINSDAPLDVNLYGPEGVLLNTFPRVKHLDIHLPPPECWIEVRCAHATRYSIFFGYMLDTSQLPPLHQREDVEIALHWWPDPPFLLHEWEKWLEIVVDPMLRQHGELELTSDRRLQWDLLTPERTVVKSSAGLNGTRNKLQVSDLAPGKYLLRVSRDAQAATRFEANQRAVVKFGVGPAF